MDVDGRGSEEREGLQASCGSLKLQALDTGLASLTALRTKGIEVYFALEAADAHGGIDGKTRAHTWKIANQSYGY